MIPYVKKLANINGDTLVKLKLVKMYPEDDTYLVNLLN